MFHARLKRNLSVLNSDVQPHKSAIPSSVVTAMQRIIAFAMSGFVPFRGGSGGGGPFRGGRGGRHSHNRQFGGDGGRGGGGRSHRGPGRGGRGPRGGRHYGPPRLVTDLPITELGTPSDKTITFAVEGCCHGELDSIYERLRKYEEEKGRKIDVLLCCGDFQSVRNAADYHSMAVPAKYRTLGSFCRYYSGEKVAPVLTLFVGGNHEASQPLQELYYGGWVAPKIYYLGAAGVVNVGGVRIGGISGIYKDHDYNLGRFELPPFDNKSLRSIYHTRSLDVFRMKCLSPSTKLDIMLSHDWPEGVERYGNMDDLLRRKPYFRSEVEQRCLGSPPNRELLEKLQPKWWFAAHLHVKFSAVVNHTRAPDSETKPAGFQFLVPSQTIKPKKSTPSPRKDESDTFSVDAAVEHSKSEPTGMDTVTQFQTLESPDQCEVPDLTKMMTEFLSLDKCLPRRHCLCVVHVPVDARPAEIDLEYDLEWFSILRKTHALTIRGRRQVDLPSEVLVATPDDIEETKTLLQSVDAATSLRVPHNFCKTVPCHDDPVFRGNGLPPPFPRMGNPQTDELLSRLGLEHIITVPYNTEANQPADLAVLDGDGNENVTRDENEIEIDSGNESGDEDMPQVDQDKRDELVEGVSDCHQIGNEAAASKKPRLESE